MYREHHGLNQSFLKAVLKGTIYQPTPNNKAKRGYRLGSYIDALCTKQDLSTFIIDDTKPPSDEIAKIIDMVSEWDDDLLLFAAENNEYGGVGKGLWEEETILKKLKKYKFYFDREEDKYYLTTKEKLLCEHVAGVLKTHPFVRAFLSHPNLEYYYQYDFYWQYKNKDCKGLADIVIVNRSSDIEFANGYIMPRDSYLIVDVKTGIDHPEKLKYTVWKYNYYFQLSYYYYGLAQVDRFQGLQALDPVIVYGQTSYLNYPSWFVINQKGISGGRYGWVKVDDSYIPMEESFDISTLGTNPFLTDLYIPGWDNAFYMLDKIGDTPYYLNKNKGRCY